MWGKGRKKMGIEGIKGIEGLEGLEGIEGRGRKKSRVRSR